jgi:hypothetical protein
MQNLENEKLKWEAPRLIINIIENTESGIVLPSHEGEHSPDSFTIGS